MIVREREVTEFEIFEMVKMIELSYFFFWKTVTASK